MVIDNQTAKELRRLKRLEEAALGYKERALQSGNMRRAYRAVEFEMALQLRADGLAFGVITPAD